MPRSALDFDFNMILNSRRPASGLPISGGFLGAEMAWLGHPSVPCPCLSSLS